MEGADVSTDDYTVAMVMQFDNWHDAFLNESEFVQGVAKWLNQGTLPAYSLAQGLSNSKSRSNNLKVGTLNLNTSCQCQ